MNQIKFITLLAGLSMSASAAFALPQNLISFRGEVSSQTCNVDINGSPGSPVVLLPTVATASLVQAQQSAGKTTFTVNLTGCTAPNEDQNMNMVFQGINISSGGNLANTGTAKNVVLRLLDTQSNPISLSDGQAVVPGITLKQGNQSTSADYGIEYYTETGEASPGSVLSSVQYAINYP